MVEFASIVEPIVSCVQNNGVIAFRNVETLWVMRLPNKGFTLSSSWVVDEFGVRTCRHGTHTSLGSGSSAESRMPSFEGVEGWGGFEENSVLNRSAGVLAEEDIVCCNSRSRNA